MKIEKVNDNQIRCTLTRDDLASRELKISELAYGTEKAKNLFRDMMQQASYEFGFEAEDIPLMIEAIPLNAECIVLIITKVEDPEELDTRFSRFAPASSDEEDGDYEEDEESSDEISEDVMDLFRKLHDTGTEKNSLLTETSLPDENGQETTNPQTTRVFQFDSLKPIMTLGKMIGSHYVGLSSLYKDDSTGKYLLSLVQGSFTNNHFNRICNMMSEYGTMKKITPANQFFLDEHGHILLRNEALQTLSEFSYVP